MSAWANAYVGIPFAAHGRGRGGLDCWGLVRLVYAETAGIDLPCLAGSYVSPSERAEIDALVGYQAPRWRRTEAFKAFDVAVFRRGRLDAHVGVLVSQLAVLHVVEGQASRIETLDAPHLACRLTAVYRHKELDR